MMTFSSIALVLSQMRYQIFTGPLGGSLLCSSLIVGRCIQPPADIMTRLVSRQVPLPLQGPVANKLARTPVGAATFVGRGGGGSSETSSCDNHSKVLVDLEYNGKNKVLRIEFEDGARFSLPAEFLRTQSPAAVARSKTVVHGRRHIGIIDIEPVGRYAVKIVFDDLHSSGLYTYEYLRQLGEDKFGMMRRYIRQLRAAGLSRDPLKNSTRRDRARSLST